MTKRISVTPGAQLRLVPNRWQSKFASEAAEILIREGRSSEVLQSISGLTLADLTGESSTLKETGKNKKKHCYKVKQANTTCSSSNLSSQQADIPEEESSTSENPQSTVSPDETTNGIKAIQANLFDVASSPPSATASSVKNRQSAALHLSTYHSNTQYTHDSPARLSEI